MSTIEPHAVHIGTRTRQSNLIFSVDLEDYFHVAAFEPWISRDSWPSFASRTRESTLRLLDLLDEQDALATFFVLGWLAERDPTLVREVAARGHEVAAHSYWHERVTALTPKQLLADALRTRVLLEDIVGVPVEGHRAPSFSITRDTPWAFECLVAAGYTYDSSVFPIRRDGYGYRGAPRAPYVIDTSSGPLQEYPMATIDVAGFRVPAAGGGYLRHFPYGVTAAAARHAVLEQRVAVFYIHPWEIDTDQPRLRVPLLTRWRHYGGLHRTEPRLRRLLGSAPFTSFQELRARVQV